MISKRTVEEVLEDYLDEKGLSEGSIRNIKKHLHKDIENEGEEKSKEKETTIIHGTSCPRILNKFGELIVEM